MDRGPFILVVEDEDPSRSALVSSLAERGYSAAGVRNLADARRLLRRVVPDVLLLDLGLPDGSGEELLRQLRASSEPRLLRVPVVVVSGWSDARAHATSADAVLQKPVAIDAVVSVIRSLTSSRERASTG